MILEKQKQTVHACGYRGVSGRCRGTAQPPFRKDLALSQSHRARLTCRECCCPDDSLPIPTSPTNWYGNIKA